MSIHFPPEWHPQFGVQLTWPHAETDWQWILPEVTQFYFSLANTILEYENLVICAHTPALADEIKRGLSSSKYEAYIYVCPSNDTWARDHGPIFTFDNGQLAIRDFQFNGWGNKFDAHLDNQITQCLAQKGAYPTDNRRERSLVLEGGSIESDGLGTLLTTKACLLNKNRNPTLSQSEIETELKQQLGVSNILWLENGHLDGDDTDAHIDTLARLCPQNRIVFQGCQDTSDSHYASLQAMKQELAEFKNALGEPFELFELPLPQPVYESSVQTSETTKTDEQNHQQRLPATYANFLIINGAVLFPVYNLPQDEQAVQVMQQAMPEHTIVPVDCSVLVRQYGSLHCITMQIPDRSDPL